MFLRFNNKRTFSPEAPSGTPAGEAPTPDTGASLLSTATPATSDPASTPGATPATSAPAGDPAQNPGQTPAAGPEGAKAEPGGEAAPLTIEALKLPEGFTFPEEASTAFLALMNNAELAPQERAQQLIDLYAKQSVQAAEAGHAAQVEAWTKLNNDWRAEVAKLPEFSAGVEKELGAIKQVLVSKQFGADEKFFEALNLTGAGNNPHVLQMLHKLTAPFREGKAVGGVPTAPTGDRLRSMYPSMAKE